MKNPKLKKFTDQVSWWLGVVTIGLFLGVFIQFTQAWVDPPNDPPNSNIGAPVNTGDNEQIKDGPLYVNRSGWADGLIVLSGNMGIGTLDPNSKLDVRGNIRAHNMKIYFGNNDHYGWLGVYRGDGQRGAYFGYGNGSGRVNLYMDKANTLAIHGGDIDMNNNWIRDVRGLKVSNIYDEGGGSWIQMWDHLSMNNRVIYDAKRVRVTDTWPSSNNELATKRYVDSKASGMNLSGCYWTGWASASKPGWARASCGSGKVVRGWRCRWSKNTEENEEIMVMPHYVQCRYVHEGSVAYARAYCCNN
jgi:hypothetical protein